MPKKGKRKSNAKAQSSGSKPKSSGSKASGDSSFRCEVESLFYKTKWDDQKRHKCIHNNLVQDGSIFEIKNFITKGEAKKLIDMAENAGFAESFQRETRECAHRQNGRLQFNSEALALLLYKRISRHFCVVEPNLKPVALSDNFRLYKYTPGQRFGPHIDESVVTSSGHETLFTLLIYLNDEGLLGGETVFYEAGSYPGHCMKVLLKYKPKACNALIHMHGDNCLLHEGSEVKAGQKYLLRTDVCYVPS